MSRKKSVLDENKMMNSFCTVEELRSKVQKIERAGIIPYLKTRKGLLFWFGVDPSGDLTDFGGRSKRSDRDFLNTAIREFQEESLGVFGEINIKELTKSLCVYDGKMVIIFYRLNQQPCFLHSQFDNLVQKEEKVEVENLFCVDQEKMVNLVTKNQIRKRLYERIKTSLFNCDLSGLLGSI